MKELTLTWLTCLLSYSLLITILSFIIRRLQKNDYFKKTLTKDGVDDSQEQVILFRYFGHKQVSFRWVFHLHRRRREVNVRPHPDLCFSLHTSLRIFKVHVVGFCLFPRIDQCISISICSSLKETRVSLCLTINTFCSKLHSIHKAKR